MSGRAWPMPSSSPGTSSQAVTKEASAGGDLKPLQIPHLRQNKTCCWAELHVLLQSTQVPYNEQNAEDVHKVQCLLDLPPGLAANLGESLYCLCLHLPSAVRSVVIHRIYSQTEIFVRACQSSWVQFTGFKSLPADCPFPRQTGTAGPALPCSNSGIPPRFPSLGPVPAAEAVLSGSQTPSLSLLLPLSRASPLLGLAYNTVCGAGTKMTGLPPSRTGNTFIGPSIRQGD